MSSAQGRQAKEAFAEANIRFGWRGFLILGIALVICGTFALAAPVISTIAVTLVLGITLVAAGIMKMIQAFTVKRWSGFVWQLFVGAVEIAGGLLVYLNPMKGAIAITVVIGIVFAAEGVTQLVLAFKMRTHRGWGWMLFSGLVALLVCAVLAMQFPYNSFYTPGTLVGVSLLFAGWAYIAIALAARKVLS